MAATADLTLDEIEALAPEFHGPTWQKDAFGQWKLPACTLGWQIAGWCAEYLHGAVTAGAPLRASRAAAFCPDRRS
ncbi:hypothetical protein ACWEOV_40865 [Streptomyces sp. NPDC004365]